MLKEHATHFYLEDKCNCAEAVVLAANAEYNLGLSDDVCKLVGGFGAGVSCGSTCGALLGAISVYGVMKMGRRAMETYGFNKKCGDLARDFMERMGDSNCSALIIFTDKFLKLISRECRNLCWDKKSAIF